MMLSVAHRWQLTLWYLPCSPLHNRDLHNIADLKHVYESAFNRVGTERLRNMIRAHAAPCGRPLHQGLRISLHPSDEVSGERLTCTPLYCLRERRLETGAVLLRRPYEGTSGRQDGKRKQQCLQAAQALQDVRYHRVWQGACMST